MKKRDIIVFAIEIFGMIVFALMLLLATTTSIYAAVMSYETPLSCMERADQSKYTTLVQPGSIGFIKYGEIQRVVMYPMHEVRNIQNAPHGVVYLAIGSEGEVGSEGTLVQITGELGSAAAKCAVELSKILNHTHK